MTNITTAIKGVNFTTSQVSPDTDKSYTKVVPIQTIVPDHVRPGGYTGTIQALKDEIDNIVITGGGTPTGGYQGTSQELQTQILAMGDPNFDFEQQVDTLLTF